VARTRHLLAVLLGAVMAVVGGFGWMSMAGPAAAAAAPAQARTPARAACSQPAPRNAAGYQAMFDAKNDASWGGGDQAASVALPGGRVLWMFGDTVRGHRLVHNAMLVQTGGCLTAVPAADEVVPTRADGEWYWPQSAIVVGDRLIVFCARVRRTGPGPFGFRTTGVDAAVFALTGVLPSFLGLAQTPSSRSPETGAQYGKAVLIDGGWLYVYGSRQIPAAFGRAVTVARVRPSAVLRPSSWEYWNGTGWSARAQRATPVATSWSSAFSVWRASDGSLVS
jgi:hypothetical protein